MGTLTLREAASFLKVHPETLRQKIKSGEIPAAKIGRSYVLVEEDLVEYVRSQYSADWRAVQVTNQEEKHLCHYTVDKKTGIGGLISTSTDEEYENLLKPGIKKTRSDTTIH